MGSLAALFRKDRYAARNLGRLLQRESLFKTGFVATFMAGLLLGLFFFFLRGFIFLASLGGAGFMITRYLFSFFFLGLGAMLVLSNVVSTYSTTFRSRQVPYLLTGPFSFREIVTYTFYESCLLSSWAFFFVMLPFTAAYAWHEKLSLFFPLWTLLFSLPFLVLCCGLGALLALVGVRFLPTTRSRVLVLVLTAVALVLVLAVRRGTVPPDDESRFILARLVPGLQAASWPLSPSWWCAEGIMDMTRGQVLRGTLLWCVLLSNTLLVVVLVQEIGRLTFYRAYQRLTGSGATLRRHAVLLPWMDGALGFLRRDVRGMVLKDVRTFLRDPLQWSQALIFFGLLAFYFASMRSFHYNALVDQWRNFITFLNLFSVSAVLCSLSARFVYPQLSLEGHGFWILGLSPATKGRILLCKFGTALLAMLAVSGSLIWLSTTVLGMPTGVRLIAVSVIAGICVATSALSTGLGAVFLDLKQSNPVAIVSGFGGTVNLVLSLLYMLSAIVPFAALFHLHSLGRIGPGALHRGLAWAGLWLAGLTLVTAVLPLYAGYRSLSERDY